MATVNPATILSKFIDGWLYLLVTWLGKNETASHIYYFGQFISPPQILGRSIDERSPSINTHKDFGNWECDLVLGHKTKDNDVLLTLCKRKTRRFFMIKIEDKTSDSVMKAFDKLRKFYGSKWNKIFKSITTDNGSEFAYLSNLTQVSKTLVYYAIL